MRKIIILILLLITIGTVKTVVFPNNTSSYTIKTFEIDNGWGYSIFKNDKLVIRQKEIPAIQTKKRFETKDDAETCAKIMLNKLKERKIPSITKRELQQNNIHL